MYSTSSHRCYGTGNICPSSTATSCTHSEDVTVQCCKCMHYNSALLHVHNTWGKCSSYLFTVYSDMSMYEYCILRTFIGNNEKLSPLTNEKH